MAADMSAIFVDDTFESEIKKGATVTSIIYGFGILVSIMVIYGAMRYQATVVGLGIVWSVVQTVVGIVLQAKSYTEAGLRYPIFDAVIRVSVSTLLIYPLAVFVSEVRSGVMSKATYLREEHSCCCV
jgi:fructose-bisphosphate aldolase class 1